MVIFAFVFVATIWFLSVLSDNARHNGFFSQNYLLTNRHNVRFSKQLSHLNQHTHISSQLIEKLSKKTAGFALF